MRTHNQAIRLAPAGTMRITGAHSKALHLTAIPLALHSGS
jgi:hypothetical protein